MGLGRRTSKTYISLAQGTHVLDLEARYLCHVQDSLRSWFASRVRRTSSSCSTRSYWSCTRHKLSQTTILCTHTVSLALVWGGEIVSEMFYARPFHMHGKLWATSSKTLWVTKVAKLNDMQLWVDILSNKRAWMLDSGFWLQDPGLWILQYTRHRIQDAGSCILCPQTVETVARC